MQTVQLLDQRAVLCGQDAELVAAFSVLQAFWNKGYQVCMLWVPQQ